VVSHLAIYRFSIIASEITELTSEFDNLCEKIVGNSVSLLFPFIQVLHSVELFTLGSRRAGKMVHDNHAEENFTQTRGTLDNVWLHYKA
jgi:hypothetical protein